MGQDCLKKRLFGYKKEERLREKKVQELREIDYALNKIQKGLE